jgi:hypothetical protein
VKQPIPEDAPASSDDAHREFLLKLYSIERAEQQTAIQQTIATVAAGVAYTVAVGALLFSKCDVDSGCAGVDDAVLFAIPLPALAFLGFLINNQALIELRDSYIRSLEEELAKLAPIPRAASEANWPYFVLVNVKRIYGPGERWDRLLVTVIWGLAAYAVAAGITVVSILFSDGGPWTLGFALVYFVVWVVLTIAAVNTVRLNRGVAQSR